MLADLRAAARQLRRAPGFSALVALVLALGIAVNVATFGALDALLFRPPAGVGDPGGVRRLEVAPAERPGQRVFINLGFSRADAAALRARRERFVRLGAYAGAEATRTDPALAAADPARRRVRLTLADADYFRALGVGAARGRLFGADEARAGAGDVVVLADAFWRRAFGADPAAVARALRLNGRAYTVVGVLPRGFRGVDVEPADAFVPLAAGPVLSSYGERAGDPNTPWLRVVARLAPGADARGAAATATAVLRAQDAARPRPVLGFGAGPAGRQVEARALTERFGGGGGPRGPASPVPLWLLGATGAVLLVACANVANLLLVRAERRRREIATRAAVGAGRGRLVRQLFAEGLLLAAAGGALGLLLAALGARLFRLVPRMPEVDGLVGGRAALFAVGVTAATTLLFALAPAVTAARADGAELLRAGARQVARRAPLRALLVGVQFAASLALLGVGGLFVRSLRNVRAVDVGFDAERLLVASVDWAAFGLDDAAADAARRAAAVRLRTVPGVAGVTRAMAAPFAGIAMSTLRVPGRGDLGEVSGVPGGMFVTNQVDAAYAEALGTPVVRGRWLARGDDADPGAVVVNQAFARRVWPGADAVGRCVFLDSERDACTRVAGVVRDAHFMGVTAEVAPVFYRLAPDSSRELGSLLVRVRPGATPAEVARVAAQVAASLRAAEPRIGFATASTVADRAFGDALAPYRLAAAAFSVFGALALAMAAVGLYGAAAYAVAQRTGEFGVRVALGARGRDVAALVLGQGLRTVAAGGAAGAVGVAAVGRLLRARLYGVGPADPVAIGATALVLAAAALLAAWLPARRAARVDPAAALRAE